jgi:hypothetical protein
MSNPIFFRLVLFLFVRLAFLEVKTAPSAARLEASASSWVHGVQQQRMARHA